MNGLYRYHISDNFDWIDKFEFTTTFEYIFDNFDWIDKILKDLFNTWNMFEIKWFITFVALLKGFLISGKARLG